MFAALKSRARGGAGHSSLKKKIFKKDEKTSKDASIFITASIITYIGEATSFHRTRASRSV